MNLMKTKIFIGLVAIFITCQSAMSVEGNGTSGGGGTHTCLNSDGTVKSSEMYDLYEARELKEFKIINPGNKNANELLVDAMKKIWLSDPVFANAVKDKLQYYVEHKKPKTGKEYTIIKDATIVMVDVGWKISLKTSHFNIT